MFKKSSMRSSFTRLSQMMDKLSKEMDDAFTTNINCGSCGKEIKDMSVQVVIRMSDAPNTIETFTDIYCKMCFKKWLAE
jgi:hypothetical protein